MAKLAIVDHLRYLFGMYDDSMGDRPDLTLEGYLPDIRQMIEFSESLGVKNEIKIGLEYILKDPDIDPVLFVQSLNYDADDREEIEQIIGFTLQADWGENCMILADIKEEIKMVSVRPGDWYSKFRAD